MKEAAKPDKTTYESRPMIHLMPKVMAVKPRKTGATLKPCTPLPPKRKGEPSQWVQSSFTKGKTYDLEGSKKKLKTKA
ncbi:hypothetical protein Bca4012_018516 [Brassica carinata]|uniref:Uncharacterized protein n=1 Tax=Brassica carinata TaxID=52824 RepID=A0A8X7WNA1_BRACI|nr:hypothetical protein Bca52824_003085 [Brassica carinata]